VEHEADDAGLQELLQKIKALREAGLRAEHVAFSFMKRRVHPLMARDTLRYQYTGDDDTSRMPSNERSRSPAPTVEELVSQMTQRTARVVEPQAAIVESRQEPSATTGAEEPVAAQAEEEAPAEAGLVDIASIFGAPTVTVVRSSL
jgi:hypothetical protein